jgi:hypothetical protein
LRREIPRWTRADGQAVRCGCCGNGVLGPLLQCVGCNGLNICIRCDAIGHEHVRQASQHPCHNESHYCIIRMRPDSDQAAFPAVSDGNLAHSGPAQEAAATAHVFREDCSRTTLRSRPTTSRSDSVMVVPKVRLQPRFGVRWLVLLCCCVAVGVTVLLRRRWCYGAVASPLSSLTLFSFRCPCQMENVLLY